MNIIPYVLVIILFLLPIAIFYNPKVAEENTYIQNHIQDITLKDGTRCVVYKNSLDCDFKH